MPEYFDSVTIGGYIQMSPSLLCCQSSGINFVSLFECFTFFCFPTSYATIFSLLDLGGTGSQNTSISEADTARAHALEGASEGSVKDGWLLMCIFLLLHNKKYIFVRSFGKSKKKLNTGVIL